MSLQRPQLLILGYDEQVSIVQLAASVYHLIIFSLFRQYFFYT